MASTSSSVGLGQGHTCCPARVASCWRGRTCPYRLHGSCWFEHDDDLEVDPPCRDVAATSCRVVAATASVELEGRVRRLERIVEQIGGVPVPQIWEPIVEGPHLVPLERVQNRTPEQIMDSPVPQILEAVLPEPIMDSPVPQIMEDSLPVFPQECVLHRTQEQIVGVLVPQITEDGLPIVPQERVHNRTSGFSRASGNGGRLAGRPTGVCAKSLVRAARRCASASDHGGSRG